MADDGKSARGGAGDDKGPGGPTDIRPVSISDEMKRSYLDYAMSVIVSRALPDARDGLKPVHRRILYAMHRLGLDWNKKHMKSSKVVGDTMGDFHPHGNLAIYDALVRMAQDFSMRVPLIDGQGNFGSIDGDPPAAERYTEARLSKIAQYLLDDLDKSTVDFRGNYDDRLQEPIVLPAKFPNLLVNGSGGIAVGMATNIPPHNLGEVIDACIAHLDNPEIGIDELAQIVKGPDFPTGARILGRAGILAAYHKGRGSIMMRAKAHTEEIRKDREAIIVTAIPYQVNKRVLIEKIAEQVRDKRIEGISDLWDESNRVGMRIVIELKRDAVADVVLNQLWRHSDLQTSFGANMLAINGGRPEQLNLKDFIAIFTAFREEVVSRRTKHLLAKSRERAHVLVGLAVAVANIDEMIRLIRAAPSPADAREQMMARDWPAKDIGPLVELIADPRHKLTERQHHPPVGGAGPRHPRVAPAAPDRAWPRRDRRRVEEARRGDQGIPRHSLLAAAHHRPHQGRADRHQDRVRHPPPDRDHRDGGRGRGRGPDPARGHGRHRQPPRLHQARAALHLSRPAPRRQRPRRHVDARGGRGHPDLRRLHAHAAAVLLLARHGLPHEGVAPAGRHAAVGRQGAGQPAAAGRGRGHHLHPAAAGGPGDLGLSPACIRHPSRQRPAQQAQRFRDHQPQRQDRHEARRRRQHRARCRLHAGTAGRRSAGQCR